MEEKKMLSDEELEQVSGGGKAKEEYCGKWYVNKSNFKRYVYVEKTNYDYFYATHYTLDEAGNVSVKKDNLFYSLILMYTYAEVNITELPEAIRQAAGC